MAGVTGTVGAIGAVAGAVQGAQGGGGGGGMPRWMRKAQKANYNMAQNIPLRVAGFTPDQRRAMAGIRGMVGRFDPAMLRAQKTAEQLAGGITADDIRSFYNPYEKDVIGGYMADLDEMRGRENLMVNDAAEKASAFGGDREAVYRAVQQGELSRITGAQIADLRHRGYDTASQIALNNHGLRISGNDQLAKLIQARRDNRMGEYLAQFGMGQQQQDLLQRRYDLPRDRLALMMAAANQQYDPNGRQNYDSVGGALAGFEGGYGTGQDIGAILEEILGGL